jgi:DNA ligase-1
MWSKDSETGVMAFYHSAIQDGFEGIIIKPLDAKWQSGKRSKDWIKYKPPLIELDVVIIGGRYGDGKRANVFGSFDIAVKNGTDFTQIGCVGSGFSDEELLRLTRELRKLITESNGENFTFLPRIVLEVTGDVVTQNDDGTYALRFPRCKRIRDDKPVADVNTYEDMVNKYG